MAFSLTFWLYHEWKRDRFNFLFLVFALFGFVPLILLDKGEISLFINKYASRELDLFFMSYTQLGQGFIWVFIILLMLLIKFKYSISAVFIFLFNGIITAALKKSVFKGMPRPSAFFQSDMFYHLIDGYTYHKWHTFPSGHTITAFSIAFFLAYVFRKRSLAVILIIYAMLVGFSRVYLLQHFYEDVYAGAIFGFVAYYLGIYFSKKVFKLYNKEWANKAFKFTLPNLNSYRLW